MNSIAAQVQKLVATASRDERKRLALELRDLSHSLEDRYDTLQRVMYSYLQLVHSRIGQDLSLFKLLNDEGVPLHIKTLSDRIRADPMLLRRLLRYMASMGMVRETAEDTFTANNVTDALASEEGHANCRIQFESIHRTFLELPDFLAKNGYQNITDSNRTPFHDAYKWEGSLFSWFAAYPKKAEAFNNLMAIRLKDTKDGLNVYPFGEKYEETQQDPEAPIFVDVGGNVGHQCARFKDLFPDLNGRVVLQDLPAAIEKSLPTPGVERIVHDFYTPQPIKGARFYYLRGVLHDFSDDQCQCILENLVCAMGAQSTILIDDAVLPMQGVGWQAAQMDLLMMASHASMERTYVQWETLLAKVGLVIKKVHVYDSVPCNSVIEAVKEKELPAGMN